MKDKIQAGDAVFISAHYKKDLMNKMYISAWYPWGHINTPYIVHDVIDSSMIRVIVDDTVDPIRIEYIKSCYCRKVIIDPIKFLNELPV